MHMYYSETKVIMGGLAHVPILIFIVNFIKGKFESIASKVAAVKTEKPKVKVVEVKEEEVQVGDFKTQVKLKKKQNNNKEKVRRKVFVPHIFRSTVN